MLNVFVKKKCSPLRRQKKRKLISLSLQFTLPLLLQPDVNVLYLVLFIVFGVILVTITIDFVAAELIDHIHYMGRHVGRAREIAGKMLSVRSPRISLCICFINYKRKIYFRLLVTVLKCKTIFYEA